MDETGSQGKMTPSDGRTREASKLVEGMLTFIEKTSRRKIAFASIVDMNTGKTENPQDRLVAHVDKALDAAYQRGLAVNQLVWTKQMPSVPGWYWWRNPSAKYEDDREPVIYKVRDYVGKLSISNCNIERSHFEKGEWAGPIADPALTRLAEGG